MRIYRRLTQTAFLLIFFFLFFQTESKGDDVLGWPVKIFLDFDPLIFISTLLSSHKVIAGFLFSLILIVVTFVCGRVFCGWICPFGTLHNMVGALKAKGSSGVGSNWYAVKYYLLFFILSSSLFTAQLAGILDPLSLLIRSLSLSIYPAFNFVIRAFFDALYAMNMPGIVGVSEFFYTFLKKTILSFRQSFYHQGLFVGCTFLVILSLNLVKKRFWCRYLCPLGALLGIMSRNSVLKRSVSEECTSCGLCKKICTAGAIVDDRGTIQDMECIVCTDCDDLCPQGAISFGFSGKRASVPVNVKRRTLVAAVLAGVAAIPFLRIDPSARASNFRPELIRPPGALPEKSFLATCIRCGECMKVCITNGLQPTILQAGVEGIWTPVLVPTIGPCEYRCTLCGQVCPTGAIEKLTVGEKAQIKIGVAMIDRGRCLPYAYGIPCIVCEEMCPTPKKAIWLETVSVKTREGREIAVKQPKIDLELCVGCGMCETKCPVAGKPAIYVISTGESRSEDNRILLI